MTFSYTIRKLGSLPWPSSLGKDIEFPGLREKLRAVLGDNYADPAAHRDALHNNPDYRAIVEIALESERTGPPIWSTGWIGQLSWPGTHRCLGKSWTT